ncbi:MAG: arylmalonate decarboxylase [Betaproteobacteria bacterium]|nr:arylmalonate decarboxylase [Betaproteobacteria bacterium]
MSKGVAAKAKTRDSLGNRMTFGVIIPSTNTSVEPEFEAMRPHGVTNHTSRIIIPDTLVTDDKSFMVMLNNIRDALVPAIESVMSANVNRVVMGMSAETFWDGKAGQARLQKKVDRIAGSKVVMGSDACRAALAALGKKIKRLGIITPYMPVGDRQVHRFFTDSGFEVVNLLGLKCSSPVLIAHVSKERLRDAIIEVNQGKVDAVVQVGTNLAMGEVAAMAEFWLGKPVLAINTATYWYALRANGIDDKVYGWGNLLQEH